MWHRDVLMGGGRGVAMVSQVCRESGLRQVRALGAGFDRAQVALAARLLLRPVLPSAAPAVVPVASAVLRSCPGRRGTPTGVAQPATPRRNAKPSARPCNVLVVARPPVDTHEWVSFEDEDEERTWVFDVSFLTSNWKCIFGEGCQGVLTGPAPELVQGCCSYGAHLIDKKDARRVEKIAKTLTADAQRQHAERQLFGARRALAHLVELYDKGQWRLFYKKEEAFAAAVRAARQAVEHWTSIIAKCDSGSAPVR